ncbi:MAG: electron transfer flavoprotein subunit alpha/FixB family protein [Gemmatimonadetes bacterium]|nr:electron transfer flavoprotein subunit alpha/FixB family protein [Gemmatimonadota bacterium]MBI2614297.1 electron transfer flavoprotein subunit alpha/FixB family protein [Gemmatimonadota bacterium]
MAGVLVILEQRDGVLKKVSYEVVTAARSLADRLGTGVDAIAIGPMALDATGATRFGADEVVILADDHARLYQPHLYVRAVLERAKTKDYGIVLLSATALGKDLGPRLAARLGCPLAADVTDVGADDGIVVSRPVYAGKAVCRLKVVAPRCVISIRPNSVTPVEQSRTATLQHAVLGLDSEGPVARTASMKAPAEAKLDVAEASIVVSGGRGLKEPANFKLLEDLAQALGPAAVGASRAVVDAGWRVHGDQVGQTGKTVSPSLYFAIGISGAIQHLAGMRTAKVIVAINKDKDAPIFKVADYGIVGDLFEIVPRLTEEIKKVRAGA